MSMTVTRRQVAAGLAAAMLPFAAHSETAALEEAARKEGTLTWYIAQVDTETAEVMGRAFTAQLSRRDGRGDPHHRPGRL